MQFFGPSLVFSCFFSCLPFKDKISLVFLIKLYNLQKHGITKTLNYGQKVQSVYSPKDIENASICDYTFNDQSSY
jgi:hypothetical protein